jgi:hypothetical protein
MHFWISLGALAGFILFSASAGYIGGVYSHYLMTRPAPARKG